MKRPLVVAVACIVFAAIGLFLLQGGPERKPALPTQAPPPAAPVVPPVSRPAPAPAPAPPSVPAPPAPARALITVYGPDGKPVEAATVTLVQNLPESEAPPILERRTGPDGRASFPDLPGRYYTVRVEAAGMVEGKGRIQPAPGTEATREFRMERDRALRGRVTAARGGTPLPGARVVVHRSNDIPFFRGPPLASVATDADGRFRAEGIPMDERVAVLVSGRGFVEARRMVSLSSADPGGEEVEVVLDPGGALEGILRDAGGAPVAGATVLVAEPEAGEEEDEGIPGLLEEPGTSSNGRTAFEARTGADGGFAVEGLPLGVVYATAALTDDHRRSEVERGIAPTEGAPRIHRDLRLQGGAIVRVRILAPDGAPPRGAAADFPLEGYRRDRWTRVGPGVFEARIALPGPVDVAATAFDYPFETRTVQVPGSGTVEVEFRLRDGVAIEGVVVDQDGNPLARVGLEPSRRGPADHEPVRNRRAAVSGPDGKFRIPGLHPGIYAIHTRIGGDLRIDRDGRIEAPSAGVRIVVPRAASAVVRLRLPEGRSPPDTVEIGRWEIREQGRSGSTDGAPWNGGTIRWSGIPPGKTRLTVRAKGFAMLTFDLDIAAGKETDLGEVDFAGSSTLEVRVTDPSGKPVAGAGVVAGPDAEDIAMSEGLPEEMLDESDDGEVLRTTTGEDGRCSFGSVEHPEITLIVSKEGFLPSTVQVRPAGASPLVVVLHRGGLLKGTVLLPDGTRPGSVLLTLTTPTGEKHPASGSHWLLRPPGILRAQLPAGTWRIEASEDREDETPGAKGTAEITLEEGGTAEAEIRLAR